MGKISKQFLAFCAIVLLCGGLCLAQNTPATANTTVNEADFVIGGADAPVAAVTQNRATSTVGLLLRMIVMLAVVIGCIYLVIWFMRRATRTSNNNNPFLRVVSTITISPGRTVSIITLVDHAYIIGVTDNSVNLIGEVADKELVDAMNVYADKQDETSKPRDFNEILSLFMSGNFRKNASRSSSPASKSPFDFNKNNTSNTNNIYGDSVNSLEELLRSQRNRLNEGE